MIQLLLIGFISQPGRYPKASWFQIEHIRYFWYLLSFISLAIWHPTGSVGWLLREMNFLNFDVFWTPLESVYSWNSEAGTPYLALIYCMCGSDCSNVRVLLLFSGATLSSWLGIFLGYFSRYGVNQVSLRSIFSGAPLHDICYTISIQFGGIVTSLMNITVEKSSSKTT